MSFRSPSGSGIINLSVLRGEPHPGAEHALIPNLKGAVTLTPRQVLARDILNLRQFTNTPNSSLKQLIQLHKDLYPGIF
jgi:hypothetical protein